MADNSSKQVTLGDATKELMQHIDAKVDRVFGEKWKGNTDMVRGLTMKVVVLQAFDMQWALPQQYQALQKPVLRDFQEDIQAVEELYLEASTIFHRQGLDEHQAMNETRNQMFMALAEVIPGELVSEIQDLIHTSLGSGKC
jgi:hypothetical protein